MNYLTNFFENSEYGRKHNSNYKTNTKNITLYELQTKEKFSFKSYNGFFFSS